MHIPQNSEILFYVAIVAHLSISVIIIIVGIIHKTDRIKHQPILFGINLAVFLAIVFVGSHYLEFSNLDFVSFLGYSLIVSYVITIEVPGYILLSNYDKNLVKILQSIRKNTIDLNYNFEKINDLERTFEENKTMLKTISIDEFIDQFVKRCKTIQNLDKSLYEITVKELGEHIQFVSRRSKHPFPKLIEILSFAGISFLLAQFLNHLLP